MIVLIIYLHNIHIHLLRVIKNNYPTPNVCITKSIPDSSAGCSNTELSANYFYYSSINSDSLVKFNYYGTPNADQLLEFIINYKNNTEEVRDTSVGSSGTMNYILSKKLSEISAIIITLFTNSCKVTRTVLPCTELSESI